MNQPPSRCYLHVGLPKTGTSYLQSIFWRSPEELTRQRLTVLPKPVSTRSSTQLMLAVRNRLVEDIDTATSRELLTRFRRQAAEAAGSDILVSQEQLASATLRQVRRLVRQLPKHEVHVIVTARALSRQIPSGWQERVKTRSQLRYDDFLQAVVSRAPVANDFWRHQDLLDVIRRWGSTLPPENVHVVLVPPPGAEPQLLLQRYCRVLGIDAETLTLSRTRSNSSLGIVQAELLRRVNVALGDRLPRPRDGYSKVAKWYLASEVLHPQGGAPPLMPKELEQWCRDTTAEWVSELDAGGYDVVGDLADLVPRSEQFASTSEPVDDHEVAEAAVAALATILELRTAEVQKADALRTKLKAQATELSVLREAAEAGAAKKLLGLVRRGRVR